MKHAKTAALVAGSVVALGAVSPAFAADASAGPGDSADAAKTAGKAPQGQHPVDARGAENALSGKELGASQAIPMVRSLTESKDKSGDSRGKAARGHQERGQDQDQGRRQSRPSGGAGQQENSSPLSPLTDLTKQVPLLGGLPLGG